jgi:hypothetical protein
MKRLFTQIQGQLVKLGEQKPQGNALKRINNLSGFISGMIRKGSSHLVAIGSGLPKDINAHSKTIAAKRFVENKWTDFDVHFLPYLLSFLRGILAFTPLVSGIVLVIDGSQIGKDNAALMISLVWRKRGIPICWFVKKGSKGHFKAEDHEEILKCAIEIMRPLLGQNMPVTLLGDGEFDGIGLQKLCLAEAWNYVLRTACNSIFYENKERFEAKGVSPHEGHNCVFIDNVEFTEARFKYVNFVCWHDRNRHEDAIYLISNLICSGEIIEFYDQRYSIECLFKDLKSSSFNLHKTRLKNPEHVSNLIIIAALAFILLTVLAIQYDEPIWRKKVQRVRKDRKVLSFFTFAYRLIDHFIEYNIDFNFSFQFSKNFNYNYQINSD